MVVGHYARHVREQRAEDLEVRARVRAAKLDIEIVQGDAHIARGGVVRLISVQIQLRGARVPETGLPVSSFPTSSAVISSSRPSVKRNAWTELSRRLSRLTVITSGCPFTTLLTEVPPCGPRSSRGIYVLGAA